MGGKAMVCAKVYQQLPDEDSEDEDGHKKHKRKKKKQPDTVLSHNAGPTRRDLAEWGSNLHSNLQESSKARPMLRAMPKDELERQEIGIREAFAYNDSLDRDHFKLLVMALSRDAQVEEVEVDWVMRMVDKQQTGRVDRSQLNEVKCAVAKYIIARDEVHAMFSKYDKDKSGILSREEMRSLLTELNDGIRVTDQELSSVQRAASKFKPGSIVAPELKEAINFWYTNVHPPAKPDLSQKSDPSKGGAVGRAHSSMIKSAKTASPKGSSVQGSSPGTSPNGTQSKGFHQKDLVGSQPILTSGRESPSGSHSHKHQKKLELAEKKQGWEQHLNKDPDAPPLNGRSRHRHS